MPRQVGIGHEGEPLLPGPVARREVLRDVVIVPEQRLHLAEQLRLHRLGLAMRAVDEAGLFDGIFPPHDLVDPLLVDLRGTQFIGDVDAVASGAEEGGRTLPASSHARLRPPSPE